MPVKRQEFASADALAEGLADAVAANLANGIRSRGMGVLAVSGGSTPKRFFKALSTRKLDWKNVIVTLVDERWVDSSSERSNARLVNDNLLVNEARDAVFVSLWSGGERPDTEAIKRTNAALKGLASPFDDEATPGSVDAPRAEGADVFDRVVHEAQRLKYQRFIRGQLDAVPMTDQFIAVQGVG